EELSFYLSGHKRQLALLPSLQLLNQRLTSNIDLSIYEEAQAGLYFSFLGTGSIKTVDEISSVQIIYCPQNSSGNLVMAKGDEHSLLQTRITPAHLAAVLSEAEEQIIQHFLTMQDKLGNEQGIIELPLTPK
ncbi:hypothetical protein ACTVFP_23600, partial [Escherichia coli]|uniref:hypothetical protein n=1 Tax=Escherichia coli TaxID=562 RepID=UPI003FA55FEB